MRWGSEVSTKVNVVIKDCVNDNAVGRFLHGGWFWQVSTANPFATKYGLARSEEKAKKKAEKAAKSLAPEPEQNYTLEV